MARGDSARKRDGQSIAYVLPNISDSVTVTPGVADAFGTKVEIIPKDEDYEHLTPVAIDVDVASVVTETVSVRLTATDEDGATKSVTKTTTADALVEFTAKDLADIHNGVKRLIKLEVDTKTDDASAGPTTALSAIVLDYP